MACIVGIALGLVGGWVLQRVGAWMATRVDWSWLVTDAPDEWGAEMRWMKRREQKFSLPEDASTQGSHDRRSG